MAADTFRSEPPTMPVDDLPPEPAQWPKTVGTISIVLACLGMLCNTCGLLGPLVQRWSLSLVPPERQEEVRQQQQQGAAFQPGPVEHVIMVIKVGLAILLLTAAISLIARKRVGATLHLAWASLALLLSIVGIVIAALKFPDQMKAMQQTTGNKIGGGMVGFFLTIGIVVTLLSLVWPVFCLIWFGVVKRGSRDLETPLEPAA